MASYSLHELKDLYQSVVNRSKSLPKAITTLEGSIEPLEPLVALVERYRASERDIPERDHLKIGLVMSLTKEYLKKAAKKPTDAWLNYRVSCVVYDHILQETENHVTAMDESKRPHKYLKQAREDKTHWLRKTYLKTVLTV